MPISMVNDVVMSTMTILYEFLFNGWISSTLWVLATYCPDSKKFPKIFSAINKT